MDGFVFYLKQGVNHITDLEGIDHMAFIITLCAVYKIKQWRQILVLVTAFTIGHTVTLALSGLKLISVNQELVETLIPVTILLTAVYNIVKKTDHSKGGIQLNYLLALFFGFIHGMGFSNFFRSMMMGIDDESIIFPLFSFNVGIELGQLAIVACLLLINIILTTIFSVKHRDWNLVISGAGGGIALTMILKHLI
ncbi:HupE/UreJ family protein [Wenyingzhuangia sp. chi5]|uniref:HupE/UreJ family protein n=1 Tax=Wenyingzhuangia gilva TaxID=3057677 RepID=A0ABT8VMP3_9FLAO|nr:HupE/UreJ family protein [Wenyingzhuangia sp. chi5]MDO3693254.1 HupE/UreJ family protein [Wenyingzhuangia sp. chi5]